MLNNYTGAPAQNFSEFGLSETFAAVLRRVYLWMVLGLLVTAGTAAVVSVSPLYQTLLGQPLLFFVYAALNGVTFSVLFVVYTLGSVAHTFLATAVPFGVMSVIGYTTKMDLSKMGSFLTMGLIGLIIAMLVNMFWANTVLGWVVTVVGILLFLGLTVVDTQCIKAMTIASLQQGDDDVQSRMGILGALALYLDFINLFLFILRLTGRRR